MAWRDAYWVLSDMLPALLLASSLFQQEMMTCKHFSIFKVLKFSPLCPTLPLGQPLLRCLTLHNFPIGTPEWSSRDSNPGHLPAEPTLLIGMLYCLLLAGGFWPPAGSVFSLGIATNSSL